MYTFHIDPGHSWLEVPIKELDSLGITSKISAHSYKKGSSAFLEEDCDAAVFDAAKQARGETVEVREKFTNYYSPIRNYERFK